jgi:hypothetical protein
LIWVNIISVLSGIQLYASSEIAELIAFPIRDSSVQPRLLLLAIFGANGGGLIPINQFGARSHMDT